MFVCVIVGQDWGEGEGQGEGQGEGESQHLGWGECQGGMNAREGQVGG